MDCSKITTDIIAAQCNTSTAAGAEGEIILINYADIDKSNAVVTDNVISKLPLSDDAAHAVKFTTFGKSINEAGASLKAGTYMNTFEHTVPLNVFIKSEESKKFVNSLAMGSRVVAILKNNQKGDKGEVKYEAYGWDNGLAVSEIANTIEYKDGVIYKITIKSADTAQESSLPKSVFDTDEKTTDDMINSLLSQGPKPAPKTPKGE